MADLHLERPSQPCLLVTPPVALTDWLTDCLRCLVTTEHVHSSHALHDNMHIVHIVHIVHILHINVKIPNVKISKRVLPQRVGPF